MQFFKGSFYFTFFGLILASLVGYSFDHSLTGVAKGLWLAAILSVLEVSLSFDNAVVNASVLKDMTPVWRKRFITWGILIAVFGMRIIFPLVVVSVLVHVSPWAALMLAVQEPARYAEVMLSSHTTLAGFGGAFLLMVSFKYFFDHDKDIHWLDLIEKPLTHLGKMEAIEAALVLIFIYVLSCFLPEAKAHSFLVAGIMGLVTYIAVDGLSAFLHVPDNVTQSMERASAGMFLYLEILDASFSFDGVIGAFALTNNLFIIAIGLGIGAMFVRSMTIYLLERGTLTSFPYLEHGAFYAIGALAVMMLLDAFIHIPETLTGLIGAVFIGLSLWASVRANRMRKL